MEIVSNSVQSSATICGTAVAPGTEAALLKLRIAVVDDDTAILKALDRLIRSQGCIAQAFSSPIEFLATTAVAAPDCLILDVQMPGMSGLELQRLLLEGGCRFPIIFITAHEDAEAEAQAKRAGAAGFFYKPFHNEDLWTAVVEALGGHKSPGR